MTTKNIGDPGEVTFAASFANPKIKAHLRDCVELVPWTSTIARNLLEFFLSSNTQFPPLGQCRAMLSNICTDEESFNILEKVKEMIMLPDKAIPGFLQEFEHFYCQKMLTSSLDRFKMNTISAKDVVNEIKGYKKVAIHEIPLVNLGKLDIDEIQSRASGDGQVLPTSFDLIRSATPYQGYLKGTLTQVVAAPGIGKSLLMMNEAVHWAKHGFHTYWVALGDLDELDCVARMASIIEQIPYAETALFPKKYYTHQVKEVLKNIQFTSLPAGQVDIYRLADFIENVACMDQGIDAFVLDYDSNLASTSDSMYVEGGNVYDKLTAIAKPLDGDRRVCMVASQPKPYFWQFDALPMECAAESSKKQAVIDLMVTLGKHQAIKDCHAGKMTIAKTRRNGNSELLQVPFKKTDYGHIQEISMAEYATMVSYTGEEDKNGGRNGRSNGNYRGGSGFTQQ